LDGGELITEYKMKSALDDEELNGDVNSLVVDYDSCGGAGTATAVIATVVEGGHVEV
jgi:hypothetical protein